MRFQELLIAVQGVIQAEDSGFSIRPKGRFYEENNGYLINVSPHESGGGIMEEKLQKYPSTPIYHVKDTIGIPHPYCIGPGHVGHADHRFSGRLSEASIEDGEKKGIFCCTCKGRLPFSEHKTALLISVNFPGELKDAPGLKDYLLSITDMAISDHFEGFTFIQEVL